MLSEKKKQQLNKLHSMPRTKDWLDKMRKSMIGKHWKLSAETKKRMSLSKIGKICPPYRKGSKMTIEQRNKMKERKGCLAPNWKGGITSTNSLIRRSEEYKLWRKSVFERDKYTCIWCGKISGNGKKVIIHADHIKPFCNYPELRFAIDNGRTLCKECHQTTDTYGGRKHKWRTL